MSETKPGAHGLAKRPALASAGVSACLISSMIGSIFSSATARPSKIWARSLALRSSNIVRLVTTSRRWRTKASKISCKFINLGWPSVRATILMPKELCNWVCWKRLLSTTSGTSPRRISIYMRIPSLSDSSRSVEIPSIFLSLTSSEIFSINRALLT